VNKRQTLTKAQRKAETVKWLLEGLTYREIREETGFSLGCISKYVNEAIEESKEQSRHGIDRLRRIELMRLDKLLRSAWPRAIKTEDDGPDWKAVQAVMDIIGKRCELLGLDAPKKLKIGELTTSELLEAFSEIADGDESLQGLIGDQG
jgi:hypothetical protein